MHRLEARANETPSLGPSTHGRPDLNSNLGRVG